MAGSRGLTEIIATRKKRTIRSLLLRHSRVRPSVATFRDGLPMNISLCQHMRMFYLVVLRRLMLALALLGIVLGPMSVSTAASAMAASSDMQMAAMPGMDSADEMPCCPDEQPSPQKNPCGSACPLALLCTSIILAHDHSNESWPVNLTSRGLSHRFLQESQLPSAIVEPPARPPKA